MAKQAMLFDSRQNGFLSFGWRLQIKIHYSQSLLVYELKFPVKRIYIIFHSYKILYHIPGCYTGKMMFANASKIIRSWFLTLQLDVFKIVCNLTKVGTRKGMDEI